MKSVDLRSISWKKMQVWLVLQRSVRHRALLSFLGTSPIVLRFVSEPVRRRVWMMTAQKINEINNWII